MPFDAKRLAVGAGPVPMVEGIQAAGANSDTSQFSVSDNGSLVYIPGFSASASTVPLRVFALVQRTGEKTWLDVPPADYAFSGIFPQWQSDGRDDR